MIQRIVVPTDFSQCAQDALDVAMLLAKQFEAELYLVHVAPALKGQSSKEASENLAALSKAATDKQLNVSTALLEGQLHQVIPLFIQKHSIDLVCMGSHGSSGFHEMFIGSNAQKLIRVVRKTLLIVKRPLKNLNLQEVVFASDFDTDEQEAFRYLVRLLKHTGNTGSHLHLLNINTGSFFSNPSLIVESSMQSFIKLARGHKTTMHFYRDYSIQSGVEHFSEKIGAQMIAVAQSKRSKLYRVLFGNHIEALVNMSREVVLVINADETDPG